MAYKNIFPGMSNFQRLHGGKLMTGHSGIIPMRKNNNVVNQENKRLFEKIFKK